MAMWDYVIMGGVRYPPDPRGPQVDAVTGAFVSHSHIAPPGLQGVLVLFVWIGALDRARQIETMPPAEQPHARRGLAQWLWLNGVRGEACWTWGQE